MTEQLNDKVNLPNIWVTAAQCADIINANTEFHIHQNSIRIWQKKGFIISRRKFIRSKIHLYNPILIYNYLRRPFTEDAGVSSKIDMKTLVLNAIDACNWRKVKPNTEEENLVRGILENLNKLSLATGGDVCGV